MRVGGQRKGSQRREQGQRVRLAVLRKPLSTPLFPPLPPFPAGRGCRTEPYLQNWKQGGGGGGGGLQRLETTLGRGGWAEPAGLAGAQGFFSWRWLAGSMTVGGPRWEDRRLSHRPPPLTFSPVTPSEGTTGFGEPLEEKYGVSCKLLKEAK